MKAVGMEGKGVVVRQEANLRLVNRDREPFTSEILVPILTTDRMRTVPAIATQQSMPTSPQAQDNPMPATSSFLNLIATASRNLS